MAVELQMIGCQCGCDCCEPAPSSEEDERAALLRQRALIDRRLTELGAGEAR